jgi:hypothetical protein
MHIRFPAWPAWRSDLVAFVAVLVTAIILISVWRLDAVAVKAVADLVAAYCAVRIATARPAGGADDVGR